MNKPWVMLLSGLLIGLLAAGVIILIAQPRQGYPIALAPAPTVTATNQPAPTPTPEPILVQISGAVQSPGVYTLPSGARLEDLIASSDGLTSAADLNRINATVKLRDGDYYYIPTPGEEIPAAAANAPGNSGVDAQKNFTYPLDLNTATQEELESLPGIGPSKAEDILTYRAEHGPFTSIEELANVPGIGEITIESLRDYLVVESP